MPGLEFHDLFLPLKPFDLISDDWTGVRKSLFSVEPQAQKGYDQSTLGRVAWPAMRDHAAIYDSYHCRDLGLGNSRAWPTKEGGNHSCFSYDQPRPLSVIQTG